MLNQLASAPHAEILARWTLLSPRGEAELESLERDLVSRLDRAGHSDLVSGLDHAMAVFPLNGVPGLPAAEISRFGQLAQKAEQASVCRCTFVAFPAHALPSFTS